MKNMPLDILVFIGGMFFYGIRNAIGKWMVKTFVAITWPFTKRMVLRSEENLKLYWQFYNHELQKRRLK